VKPSQRRIDKILVTWYLENKRDLPWRRAKVPYQVWLSEIILQQTQVVQGLPYYNKFVSAFPSVHDLAKASEQEVLKLWQGLGYYSRARNLHHTARQLSENHNGIFPQTFEGLLSLKGVGVYTASAIASICFDVPKAVVDGNVYRVLSRVFGLDLPINETAGIKRFQELADQQLALDDPGTYNQAIMEFGALQCVPKKPNCQKCPLVNHCVAYTTGSVHRLPVSVKKIKVKTEFYNFLVLQDHTGGIWMRRRSDQGIWPNLYEFPLIETAEAVDQEYILTQAHAMLEVSDNSIQALEQYNAVPWAHRLTHKKLMVVFWLGFVEGTLPKSYPVAALEGLAVPAIIARFISKAVPFTRQN
jgi:A/G-specific adenine glycosylase